MRYYGRYGQAEIAAPIVSDTHTLVQGNDKPTRFRDLFGPGAERLEAAIHQIVREEIEAQKGAGE